MRLHEQMKPEWLSDPDDHREEIKAFCTAFVDPDARADRGLPDAPTSSEIVSELTGMIGKVKDMEAHLADARRRAPATGLSEYVRKATVEVYEAASTAYRLLFIELCAALGRTGWTMRPGDPSALTRSLKAVPSSSELADALDPLKPTIGRKASTFSTKAKGKRKRVSDDDARRLYREHTANGHIDPSEVTVDDFLAWMGETSSKTAKAPQRPLKWHEDDKHLGGFVDFIREYRDLAAPVDREGRRLESKRSYPVKAICDAFGLDDETYQRVKRQVTRKPIN